MSKKDKAFELFTQGMKPSDKAVKDLKLAPKSRYNYYQLWKKAGKVIGSTDEGGKQPIGTMKSSPITFTFAKQTDAVSEAAILNLVPQTLSLPLTPDIFMSYMCALKNGYEGELGDWLSLVSRDFWFGRGRDPYAEVSGTKFSGRENNG